MKVLFLIPVILLNISLISVAQQDTVQRSRIYKTWISLNNQIWTSFDNKESQIKGLLYEVKDSSILISNSFVKQDYLKGNFKVTYIDFKNINDVRIRGKYNIAIGTTIGTLLGVIGAVGIAQGIAREDEFAGAMVLVGTPVIAVGAGIGALFGAMRIHIPINGSFENFKRNESRLEKHSYLHESSKGPNIYEKEYEHKWFFGILMGPSFPSGDFEDDFTGSSNDSEVKTGNIGNFILGYNFKENFGISASFIGNTYNMNNSTSEEWWTLVSFLAGPVFSVPFQNKFFLDLKPMIGFTNASLNTVDSSVGYGNGIGIYPSTSIRFNFSRRWCALSEVGYLFTNQNFGDRFKKMQAINLSFGIGYRFL
jgi:hypothetical protein